MEGPRWAGLTGRSDLSRCSYPRIPVNSMLLLLALSACSKPAADDSAASAGPTATLLAAGTNLADAAPSPDGSTIYYTGPGGTTLMAVRADGTAAGSSNAVFLGARGLVVDPNDGTLYVADPVAVGMSSIGTDLGSPRTIPGTENYAANAMDIIGGTLYLTGWLMDMSTGDQVPQSTGAWSVPVAGGDVSTIAASVPSQDPSGIAVASDGSVYVAGSGDNGGTVWEVSTGTANVVVDGLTLGNPAGIALNPDESALLISALDASGHAEVVIVSLADGSTTTWNGTIGANTAAGGLHRAAGDSTQYAWCGVNAGVYHVGF